MTDRELEDFIHHGETGFLAFAMMFGDGWAQHAIDIAKELRARLAQPELGVTLTIAKHPVSLGIPSEYRLSKESLEDVVLERESTCAQCEKKASDGWALYCVDCLREFYKHDPTNKREWVGLTDVEMLVAAFQAGFDVHEDFDNEDDPDTLHWWSEDGEPCDDTLHKLRNIIEAKLKDKNI